MICGGLDLALVDELDGHLFFGMDVPRNFDLVEGALADGLAECEVADPPSLLLAGSQLQ